jgi:hypothetical protein
MHHRSDHASRVVASSAPTSRALTESILTDGKQASGGLQRGSTESGTKEAHVPTGLTLADSRDAIAAYIEASGNLDG